MIDSLPEIVFKLQEKYHRLHVIWAYNDLNKDIVPWAVKTITEFYGDEPTKLLFMEPDMVWKDSELHNFIDLYDRSDLKCLTTGQVELWRHFNWRVPYRAGRASSFLLDLKDPKRHGDHETTGTLVHNFGFCISDHNMFWKHMVGLGISGPLGDSVPNEEWFEEKWISWNPTTNNHALEISKGAEKNLSHAYPYCTEDLPELITSRMDNKWPWMHNRQYDSPN